jgi:DNA-binding CsgD family transcriptional regulator
MTDQISIQAHVSRDRLLARLTPREHELLATVATGASSAEMALELGITVPTIKRHLANLYRKLGCSNRVQLSNLYHLGDPRGRPAGKLNGGR